MTRSLPCFLSRLKIRMAGRLSHGSDVHERDEVGNVELVVKLLGMEAVRSNTLCTH